MKLRHHHYYHATSKKEFPTLLCSLTINAKIFINKWLRVPLRQVLPVQYQLPDVIIAGEAKCGTTSLYNYLVQHPGIEKCIGQEVHYFDENYRRNKRWYRSHFPLASRNKMSVESTPRYYTDPEVPERIKNCLPEVKIILLFRDPTLRANSGIKQALKRGVIKRTEAESLVENELSWANKFWPKIVKKDHYMQKSYDKETILMRGRYVERYSVWKNVFGKKQTLILKSEDLFDNTRDVMRIVFSFLDLDPKKTDNNYRVHNASKIQSPLTEQTVSKLRDYYRPYNKRLFRKLNWPIDTWQ